MQLHKRRELKPYKSIRIECNAAPFPFRVSELQQVRVMPHTAGANSRFEDVPAVTKVCWRPGRIAGVRTPGLTQ
jgi:hypothetical protein